jgi:hypothetical protein
LKNHIRTIFATIQLIFKYGVPSYILYFGESLGDNLLLTTLSAALNERGYQNIWIKCDRQDLFKYNPAIRLVLPFDTLLSSLLLRLLKVKMVSPVYTAYNRETDQDSIPEKHIILKMADCIPLKGPIANKPVFNLNPAEEQKGHISARQIAIVTSTSGAKVPMQNKEWPTERYQQIVNKFSGDYAFIQLGTAADQPLANVLDLRGKTTIRETAAILKNAMLMIGHVGFMMHLARSVDCRAVIIYGGREKPAQSGYECFQNISSEVACSPCWLHNKCDFERKCMTLISADMAEAAVVYQLQLYRTPLNVDMLNNE